MNKVIQTLLLVLAVTCAKAQTVAPPPFAEVDTNFRTYVNGVFGALESQRVPTGLLLDYGFDC